MDPASASLVGAINGLLEMTRAAHMAGPVVISDEEEEKALTLGVHSAGVLLW